MTPLGAGLRIVAVRPSSCCTSSKKVTGRSSAKPTVVLDAGVLIAHLGTSDAHHELAVELLIETADETLGVSPLTLAEVLVGPARVGKLAPAQTAIRELEVVTVALSDDAPARLASLRWATGLRLPDCSVLLAARLPAPRSPPSTTAWPRPRSPWA
jgi:predicted nucleic acid-binding protein